MIISEAFSKVKRIKLQFLEDIETDFINLLFVLDIKVNLLFAFNKYKYDSKTNSWKRVSQEIVAL